MHLADVGAVVTSRVESFDPGVLPAVHVLHYTARVGIQPGEEGSATWSARGCGHITAAKRSAFIDQSIQIRRINVVEAERTNRIESLLVGEDENNIRW